MDIFLHQRWNLSLIKPLDVLSTLEKLKISKNKSPSAIGLLVWTWIGLKNPINARDNSQNTYETSSGDRHKENEIWINDQGILLLNAKISKFVKEGQNKVISPRIVVVRHVNARETKLVEDLAYLKIGAQWGRLSSWVLCVNDVLPKEWFCFVCKVLGIEFRALPMLGSEASAFTLNYKFLREPIVSGDQVSIHSSVWCGTPNARLAKTLHTFSFHLSSDSL